MSPLKVALRCPVSPNGGYGSDGIALATALTKAGVDVRLHPTHISPPLSPLVAALLTKPLEAPFDLWINHVSPDQLYCSEIERAASATTIAWSMWELSSLANLKGKSKLKKQLKNFDVFLGYSDITLDGFEPYLPKTTISALLQGGYDPTLWPTQERDWDSPRFSFIFNGEANLRKDVWTTIAAFQELKDEYPEEFEPAEFHIHTTLPSIPKVIETAIPKLRVHYETWPQETMLEFYKSGHVLVSSSHGEGKNLPCLEMLSTGGSVIATNWSGHLSWLNSQYAYPLDYELVPLHEAKYGKDCQWAATSKDHLKELMMHCFRNRAEVRHKGMVGSQVIPYMCSWDKVIEDLFLRLSVILPEKGELLRLKFEECKKEQAERRGNRESVQY